MASPAAQYTAFSAVVSTGSASRRGTSSDSKSNQTIATGSGQRTGTSSQSKQPIFGSIGYKSIDGVTQTDVDTSINASGVKDIVSYRGSSGRMSHNDVHYDIRDEGVISYVSDEGQSSSRTSDASYKSRVTAR